MKVTNGAERVTQSEAARRLGMTPQALGRWTDRPGAPVELVKGRPYCLWPAFPKWRDAEMLRKEREAATPSGDFGEVRTRKMAAEARRAEIEVEQLEGRLITIEDATREVNVMLDALRSGLLAFPAKQAYRLIGCKTLAEVTAKLEPAVHELMTVLASDEGAA